MSRTDTVAVSRWIKWNQKFLTAPRSSRNAVLPRNHTQTASSIFCTATVAQIQLNIQLLEYNAIYTSSSDKSYHRRFNLVKLVVRQEQYSYLKRYINHGREMSS